MVSARSGAHKRVGKKLVKGDAATLQSGMRVADIVALCDGAAEVLMEFGIHCAGCSLGGLESLSDACAYHGLDTAEAAELLAALNASFAAQPSRPHALEISAEAARAVQRIAKEEGREAETLLVTADGHGGFCMEFQAEALDQRVFVNPEVPGMRFQASALTLRRIGGATIDYRDGRFKLDLPEEQCADCEHDECQCGKKGAAKKAG